MSLGRPALLIRAIRRSSTLRAATIQIDSTWSSGKMSDFESVRRRFESCCGNRALSSQEGILWVWLNLVEHLLREQGIVGSNPATQTTGSPSDRDRFLHVWSSGFDSRTSYQHMTRMFGWLPDAVLYTADQSSILCMRTNRIIRLQTFTNRAITFRLKCFR